MPAAFDKCVKEGGRVRTVSGPSKRFGLTKGQYIHFCFKDGKAYRGEVKTTKKGTKQLFPQQNAVTESVALLIGRNYNRELGLLPTRQPVERDSLSQQQLIFVLLHLQGKTIREISEETNKKSAYISSVLRSRAAKNLIVDFFSFQDQEFKALYANAVRAIRSALNSEDHDVALKAAKLYLTAHGKMNRVDTGRTTAEDVVRRIMEFRLIEERPASAEGL